MSQKAIVISDAKCADCGGPVTLFAIPDKVWRGIGLTKEWVCLSCVARRVNPDIHVDDLSEEIYRRRRRFKLSKHRNRYSGVWLSSTAVAECTPGEGVSQSLTMDQVMRR